MTDASRDRIELNCVERCATELPFDPSEFAEDKSCDARARSRPRESGSSASSSSSTRRIVHLDEFRSQLHAGSFPTHFRGSRVPLVNDNNREERTIPASDDAERCATLHCTRRCTTSLHHLRHHRRRRQRRHRR